MLLDAADFDPAVADALGALLEAVAVVPDEPPELTLALEVAVVPALDEETVEAGALPLLEEACASGVKCDTVPSAAR